MATSSGGNGTIRIINLIFIGYWCATFVVNGSTKSGCVDGKFGISCEYTCHCKKTAVCDKVTGQCQNGCDIGWSGDACQIGNGPTGKTAAQESTYKNDDDKYGAKNAVDGYENSDLGQGHCSHTSEEDGDTDKPWWRLDLLHRHVLFNLTLFNRACTGCGDRLRNIKIWMTDADAVPVDNTNLCVAFTEPVADGGNKAINCTKPVIGRYLYIQLQYNPAYLALCEVKINAYQYKDCPSHNYGPNCNIKCPCINATEKCDVITGRCPKSGCNNLYADRDCKVELPSLRYKPGFKSITSDSITVIWQSWQRGIDIGSVAPHIYRLQYKMTAASEWKSFSDFTTAREATVTGLEIYTSYDFRIILGWQESPGVIQYRPRDAIEAVANTKTSCTAPSSGPDVSGSSSRILDQSQWPSKIVLFLQWNALEPGDINCERAMGYNVYYLEDGSSSWLVNPGVKSPNVELTGLTPNMKYKIKIEIVNNNDFSTNGTESEVTTADGRPGDVANLKVENHLSSNLKVTWNSPQQPYGTIMSYYIQWQHLKYEACQDSVLPLVTGEQHLNQLTTDYILDFSRLCPYCKYKIKVFAKTSGGNGTVSEVDATTVPAVPKLAPNILGISYTSRSFSLTWGEYPCKDRNGPNGKYNLEVLDSRQQVVKKASSASIIETTETINGLTPYVSYSAVLTFVNIEGTSPQKVETFTTEEEAPPPPILEKKYTSSKSITIAWHPPDPPLGLITEMEVSYRNEYSQDDTAKIFKIADGNSGNQTFRDLATNSTHLFRIRARTKINWGNWSHELAVLTEEDWPGEPINLRVTERTSESFNLAWTTPTFPLDVDLIGGKIECNPVSTLNTDIAGNLLEHGVFFTFDKGMQSMMITGLKQATRYNCSVWEEGNRGYGHPRSGLFWTNPSLVELKGESFLKIQTAQITDQTIPVVVPSAEDFMVTDAISAFLIGVHGITRKRRKRSIGVVDQSNLTSQDYETANRLGLETYIVAKLPSDFSGEFVIGDGKTYGGYNNPPLEKGNQYNIIFGVETELDGVKSVAFAQTSDPITVESQPKGSGALIGGIAGAVIATLIIVGAVVCMVVRQRRHKKPSKEDNLMSIKHIEEMKAINHEGVINPAAVIEDDDPACPTVKHDADVDNLIDCDEVDFGDNEEVESIYQNVPQKKEIRFKSHEITLDQIVSYVSMMKKNDRAGFKAEFTDFKSDLEHPHTISSKPVNKVKNRFANIVAYDHSRVILDIENIDSQMDYINANYIDGYKKKKAYIASQGPTGASVNDVWRAVWQEGCPKIVMLTNFVESTKVKCERYWPKSGSEQYGDITVTVEAIIELTDYTVTTLKISKGDDVRKLKHFHFTTWPDHGVPKFASSMLKFLHDVWSYNGEGGGPVFVHCSAGVGRTGTFIGLDYSIQRGSAEKMVNVYECVRKMRFYRPKMVQTWEQYAFLHDALMEYFMVGITAISSPLFCDRYESLVKGTPSKLQQQFEDMNIRTHLGLAYAICGLINTEVLELFIKPKILKESTSGLLAENRKKNRSKNVIPEDRCRPYLNLPVRGHNNYINAVFIDGYLKRDQFIVSQMPLPETVLDLWRLVHDHKITSIVMLNSIDESCKDGIYWPTQSQSIDCDAFSVDLLSEDTSDPHTTTRDIKFMKKSNIKTSGQKLQRTVRQFQFNSWPNDPTVPTNAADMFTLINSVQSWQQQQAADGKILVHCINGTSRSGIFCVSYSVIEKDKVDHDVDIFQFTRIAKMNRLELVGTYEEYKFIHKVVSEYLQQYSIYANLI